MKSSGCSNNINISFIVVSPAENSERTITKKAIENKNRISKTRAERQADAGEAEELLQKETMGMLR